MLCMSREEESRRTNDSMFPFSSILLTLYLILLPNLITRDSLGSLNKIDIGTLAMKNTNYRQ